MNSEHAVMRARIARATRSGDPIELAEARADYALRKLEDHVHTFREEHPHMSGEHRERLLMLLASLVAPARPTPAGVRLAVDAMLASAPALTGHQRAELRRLLGA